MPKTLKLLTYNIQVGIPMQGARHYVLRSWRHALPHKRRQMNLDRIAEVVSDYDVIALQEADAGSFRSSYLNQLEYLAERAGFDYFESQVTRDLGRFAQNAKGFLSRYPFHQVEHYRLPAKRAKGRGAMLITLGDHEHEVTLINVHLSLGHQDQAAQLDYLADLVQHYPNVVVLGDLNIKPDKLEQHPLWRGLNLQTVALDKPTYPSWRPKHKLDYIFVSETMRVDRAKVLQCTFSDHLPVAVEVSLA